MWSFMHSRSVFLSLSFNTASECFGRYLDVCNQDLVLCYGLRGFRSWTVKVASFAKAKSPCFDWCWPFYCTLQQDTGCEESHPAQTCKRLPVVGAHLLRASSSVGCTSLYSPETLNLVFTICSGWESIGWVLSVCRSSSVAMVLLLIWAGCSLINDFNIT